NPIKLTPNAQDQPPINHIPKTDSSEKKICASKQNANKQHKKKRKLAQERKSMEPTNRQDDLCLNHIRIVTGLPRSKKDFPQSPTVEGQPNKLPELPSNSTVISSKAKSGLIEIWIRKKNGGYYGIPFVGISILTQNHKALVWNRRTRAFCVDTFYCALEADETLSFFCTGFDINKYGSSRVELIVLKNFEYRIAEMTKDFRRASKEKAQDHSDGSSDSSEKGKLRAKKLRKADKQQDRRLARLKALAQRRRDTIQLNLKPRLKKYLLLFANEYLCPSDESSDDIDDPTRIKNAPVWRSKRATALCEEIDQLTAQIRQNSPKRAGRKPGKRINLGPRAPPGGLQASPCYFPVDCYHEYWLASQSPEAISALEIKQQPIFD
ncbi:hypothetical protein PSHT_16270, partial [Puccinia striiformis]